MPYSTRSLNSLFIIWLFKMLGRSRKQVQSSREVRISAEERYRNRNQPEVLYQSDNYVVLNKGYDIKVNSDDPDEMTVAQQLHCLFPQHASTELAHGYRFVHRLDYATSGALCIAFNRKAARILSRDFKQEKVLKYYLALVRGHVKDDAVYIDAPTGRLKDPDNPTWYRYCTVHDARCESPQTTYTLLIPLERGQFDGEPASKILLRPLSGRSHQLRVHCDHVGHRIIGDFTYSLRQDTAPERMMLHALSLKAAMMTETIDVITSDPFTSEVLPNWSVHEKIRDISEAKELAQKFDPFNSEDCVKT